jgi:hypothetical protein
MESLLTSNGSAALPSGDGIATSEASNSPFSPPYWKTHFSNDESSSPLHAQIQLEDHTEITSDQYKDFLWAKAVKIDDYIIVRGAAPAIGAYVVWNCTVDILDVSHFHRCTFPAWYIPKTPGGKTASPSVFAATLSYFPLSDCANAGKGGSIKIRKR